MANSKTYSEKLKDPRWQKLRLEVFERDEFACTRCGDKESTLNVHHWSYAKSGNPWDSDIGELDTVCEECHKKIEESLTMLKRIIREVDFIDWHDSVGDSTYEYWTLFMTVLNRESAEFKAAKLVFEEKWRMYHLSKKI